MPRRLRSAAARRSWPTERGALSLTYVIVLPAVFLVIMVIIQGSFWFLAREAALAAARQGIDAARVLNADRSAGPAAALAFARQAGQGYLDHPRATTSVSGTTVSVTVSGRVPSFIPGLPFHISETAQAPIEKFQP
jgi:hypothetical protein